MRKTPWLKAERYRVRLEGTYYESHHGDPYGCFEVLSPNGRDILRCLATNGDYEDAKLDKKFAWEHVSVSLLHRCPTWDEMSYIKEMFWRDDECVMQLHPPKAEHINVHPFCLHLWKPLLEEIPRPPGEAVA
jgi:hypothetical protein